jgi:hypothetical protein
MPAIMISSEGQQRVREMTRDIPPSPVVLPAAIKLR